MNRRESDYGGLWERLRDIYDVLRGPDGCAWDRAQTSASLAPYLLEEVHEILEALALGRHEALTEEAGDAAFLWVFFLQLLHEEGRVSIPEAFESIEQKLIRRHPHVFDPAGGPGTEGHEGWERRKREERGPGEVLRPLPPGIPSLARAARLQEKAAAFGFDWASAEDVLPKVREEVEELSEAMDTSSAPGARPAAKPADDDADEGASDPAREELGDLLFAVVNLARHLGIDPDAALRQATEKFRSRFNRMARSVEAAGHRLGDAPLDLLETHWQAVKAAVPPTESPPSDPR